MRREDSDRLRTVDAVPNVSVLDPALVLSRVIGGIVLVGLNGRFERPNGDAQGS